MKFQLNLPYLGYSTELRTLAICHYGLVYDGSEMSLFKNDEILYSLRTAVKVAGEDRSATNRK